MIQIWIESWIESAKTEYEEEQEPEELEEAIFANIWMPTHSDTGNLEGERCN